MPQKYEHAPDMQLKPNAKYQAIVKTNKGSFTVDLLAAGAPQTVNNFITLARDGYFDGIVFHRIIESFMIQTGDPTGTGMGGPGYQFPDELPPATPYEPGVVAMANAGPNTNGSQFFICTGEQSRGLNRTPNYSVFGRVSDGMATITSIAQTPVGPSHGGERSKPLEDVAIESVEVIETV